MAGKYIVFEGSDGTGKSSMSEAVKKKLETRFGDRVVHTRHPGATDIGSALRHLVKHSEHEIDMKTERFIMAGDNCAFIEQILKPSLKANKIVLADRSNFISDYPYGLSDGLSKGVECSEIGNIHQALLSMGAPKADAVIVYHCPWEVAKPRMFGDVVNGKVIKCKIESRGDEYFKNVIEWYHRIISGETFNGFSLRDTVLQYTKTIEYVDAAQSLEGSINDTMKIIDKLFEGENA